MMTQKSHPSIEDTKALIERLHAGQFDWTGLPYHTHPAIVMTMLPADASEDEKHAALLHDVIEDCDVTFEQVAEWGYSEGVIAILRLVSRVGAYADMSYMDWIREIVASGNVAAIRVKLADNLHNSDPERIARVPDPDKRRQLEEMAGNRYRRSKLALSAALMRVEANLP